MMGNERPCDLCVLLDYAILAYTLLKVEFFIRPVYSPKHNNNNNLAKFIFAKNGRSATATAEYVKITKNLPFYEG